MTKQAPMARSHFPCKGCTATPRMTEAYSVEGYGMYCKDCYIQIVTVEPDATPHGSVITDLGRQFVEDKLKATPEHETVLEEASRLIYGDRKEQYGKAADNFGDIGTLWSVVLKTTVTAEQAALCLLLLKVARAVNDTNQMRPIKRDTIVDLAGYAGCIAKIQDGD